VLIQRFMDHERQLPLFVNRCPLGKKTILYKKAKLEKYAHYLMKDGLVTRLSVYDDNECEPDCMV